MSSLRFIVCGMEHTGTTLISDLFRQLPNIDSGFECGVLLKDTPSEFSTMKPFAPNMLKGWGITQDELDTCCKASSFEEFYARLMSVSRSLSEGTTAIFDKTPRYLSDLTNVLRRSAVPVVVSYKDPRAMVCSDFKRAKVEDFDVWYDAYMPAKLGYFTACYKQYASHKTDDRVVTVGLEELAMNSRTTMERMFAHVGEEFQLGYAIIKELRYVNTKNRTVSADIAFEYGRILSSANCARIEKDFALGADWFYE